MNAELDQTIRLLAELLGHHNDTPTRVGRDPHYKAHRRDLLEALKMHDHRALIEDVEWMVASHEHPDRIVARLGTNRAALTRRLERIGRHDLARHIERTTKGHAA